VEIRYRAATTTRSSPPPPILCARDDSFLSMPCLEQPSFSPLACTLLNGLGLLEARMLNAFFWYTGLVFWISVAAGGACLLVADMSDRSVRRRR